MKSNNLIKCFVCGEMKDVRDITFKDTDVERLEPICETCAEEVIDGSRKLPDVVTEELENNKNFNH